MSIIGRAAILSLAPILAGLLVACGGSKSSNSASGAAAATSAPRAASTQPAAAATQPSSTAVQTQGGSSVSVGIVDFAFNPKSIDAKVGQPITVNVTNGGSASHTFKITGGPTTGTLSAGQKGTVTFTPTAAGSVVFFCEIHGAGTMSGEIKATQ